MKKLTHILTFSAAGRLFICLFVASALRLPAQIEVVSGGNVGIGTSSPASLLHLFATSRPALTLETSGTTPKGRVFQADGNAGGRIDLSSNLYFDGTSYQRDDTGQNSGLLTISGGIFNFRHAVAGSNPASLSTSLWLNSDGKVGVGTTSPGYKLDVNGTVNATDFRGAIGATTPGTGAFTTISATGNVTQSVSNNGVNRNLMLRNTSSGSSAYTLFDMGNDATPTLFEIAVTSSTNSALGGVSSATLYTGGPYKLCLGYQGGVALTISSSGDTGMRFNGYGAGTLNTDSSGNITATSDARAKDTVADFTTGLAAIRQLQPKKYHWKKETGLNTSDLNVSVYAQDLIAAGIPEAVFTQRTVEEQEEVSVNGVIQKRQKLNAQGQPLTKKTDANYYTVSDRAVMSALINAVKELAAENDTLKTRMAALEAGNK